MSDDLREGEYRASVRAALAEAYRPDLLMVDRSLKPLTEDAQPFGVLAYIDTTEHPAMAALFDAVGAGASATIGRHQWHPIVPPPTIYDVVSPVYLRLDLDVALPVAVSTSFVMSIITDDDLGILAVFAMTGLLILRAERPEMTPILLDVTWPRMDAFVNDLNKAGYVKRPS